MTSFNWHLRWLLLAGFALAFAGCSTPSRFRVDALARPDAAPLGGTYRIVGDTGDQGRPSPYFDQIADQLRSELNARGMTEAFGTAPPDVEIVVDYGVGPPRQISRDSTELLYGMGTMSTVYAQSGSGGVSPRSVYIPTQSVESKRVETKTYYESHLTIVGRQPESPRRGAAMREVWRVDVTTSDQTADVNELIPMMVTAAGEYLGTNTGERVEVTVSSSSVLAPEPGVTASNQ